MTVYIMLFLLFSFVGWIIDTVYSSIIAKRFISSGYYKNLPFCPIYGFGGIVIYQSFSELREYNSIIIILLTTFLIILLEYIGGVFCEKVLDEKLWNYSDMKFNLHGHISLLHSFYWFVLITILYYLTSPYFNSINSFLKEIRTRSMPYDLYISLFFVVTVFILTTKTKDERLKNLRKKISIKSKILSI